MRAPPHDWPRDKIRVLGTVRRSVPVDLDAALVARREGRAERQARARKAARTKIYRALAGAYPGRARLEMETA